MYNDVILAGDFRKDGLFIDESINIEIMPIQSRDVYFRIRDLLMDNFKIDNLDSCDEIVELKSKEFRLSNNFDISKSIQLTLDNLNDFTPEDADESSMDQKNFVRSDVRYIFI